MKAVVVKKAGGSEVLELREDWTRPTSVPGRVLIRVKAFGVNRGELFTRLGHSPTVSFPRVLGIECAGLVETAPGTGFQKGDTVVATTGGMGRMYDGSYAEFVSVPSENVHKVKTSLSWVELASIPESFHTAWGVLNRALDITKDQTILIRGGASSVGLVAANYASLMGVRIISTTRNEKKIEKLLEFGAQEVLIDTGRIQEQIKELVPKGVDGVFDLVGTRVLDDTFGCIRNGGILCIVGMLGGQWTIDQFSPGSIIPSTTKLTHFSSTSTPLSATALQDYLAGLEQDKYKIPLDRVFQLNEIQEAHDYMESNTAFGKIVVEVA